MAEFKFYPLAEAHRASGVVVVIDVLRAFTTAAFAFQGGAEKIIPVASVNEAFELGLRFPGSLIMGELDGYKPEGFDLGNSPTKIQAVDLDGRSLIQRTSAGTQGITRAVKADRILAASFVVAKATADYLQGLNPAVISFIVTGESLGRDGDEDRACGEYIKALLENTKPNPADYVARVSTSDVGRAFMGGYLPYLLRADFNVCTQVDIFNFLLTVQREDSLLVMRRMLT